MKKRTMNGKELGLAALFMALGAIGASCLVAVLTARQILPETMSSVASVTLAELVVLLVCYLNARKMSQSRLPAALLTATPFVVLRLLAGLFMLKGESVSLVGVLITVGVAAVGGMMASTKKKRRR